MKTISLFFSLVLSLNAAELTPLEKTTFVDYYRDFTRLLEESPSNTEVRAMFFDLDQDGFEEAFATARPSFYETGWAWTAFTLRNGKWKPIKGYEIKTQQPLLSTGIYGRDGEFFRRVLSDDTVDFVILSQNYDKSAPDGLGPLNKERFWIDGEGILRHEKIENLERYLAYLGSRRNGLIQKLETLKVEIFPGNKAQENKERKAPLPTDEGAEPEKPKK
jgi:hypothetical protein